MTTKYYDYEVILTGLVEQEEVLVIFLPNHPKTPVKILEAKRNAVILHLEQDLEGGTPNAGSVIDNRSELLGKFGAFPYKFDDDGMYVGYATPMFQTVKEVSDYLKTKTNLRIVYERK